MHQPVSYKLTCIDKVMYTQACPYLASSIIIIMHACFAHNYPEALCHIVAMGMTLLQHVAEEPAEGGLLC